MSDNAGDEKKVLKINFEGGLNRPSSLEGAGRNKGVSDATLLAPSSNPFDSSPPEDLSAFWDSHLEHKERQEQDGRKPAAIFDKPDVVVRNGHLFLNIDFCPSTASVGPRQLNEIVDQLVNDKGFVDAFDKIVNAAVDNVPKDDPVRDHQASDFRFHENKGVVTLKVDLGKTNIGKLGTNDKTTVRTRIGDAVESVGTEGKFFDAMRDSAQRIVGSSMPTSEARFEAT